MSQSHNSVHPSRILARSPIRRLGTVVALGAGLVTLGSCNIVAPIAIMTAPPPTQAAEYKLADRPTAVFVDDRRNALGERPLRRYIGDKVCENLMRSKVLVDNIPIRTRDVLAVIGQEEQGNLMSIERIGQEVGAEQMIYIEVMRFILDTEVESAAESRRAVAEVRVRVIDVVNGQRLYPLRDEAIAVGMEEAFGGEREMRYRTLFIELPSQTAFNPAISRASAREAELELADLMADHIAKLFYKHEIRPLGRKIDTSVRR